MNRLRMSFTRNARRWASSAKRQPASRKPRSRSAQTDCTTSTESNLARSRVGSFLRTTIRRYGSKARKTRSAAAGSPLHSFSSNESSGGCVMADPGAKDLPERGVGPTTRSSPGPVGRTIVGDFATSGGPGSGLWRRRSRDAMIVPPHPRPRHRPGRRAARGTDAIALRSRPSPTEGHPPGGRPNSLPLPHRPWSLRRKAATARWPGHPVSWAYSPTPAPGFRTHGRPRPPIPQELSAPRMTAGRAPFERRFQRPDWTD